MAQKTLGGKTVEVTNEGYLVNSSDWSKEIAAEMAKEDGMELTDKHYEVLEYLRKEQEAGQPPAAARALFRALRELMAEAGETGDEG